MDDDIIIFDSNHFLVKNIQSITRARDSNKVKVFKCSKDNDYKLNKN